MGWHDIWKTLLKRSFRYSLDDKKTCGMKLRTIRCRDADVWCGLSLGLALGTAV